MQMPRMHNRIGGDEVNYMGNDELQYPMEEAIEKLTDILEATVLIEHPTMTFDGEVLQLPARKE
jgi:hypothetical protein